jgi:TATA-box binding protein (TBP) (component of TFIID and TFIIIB)
MPTMQCWTRESFLRESQRIVRDHKLGATVKVPIPAKYLENADPILRSTLLSLNKTNIVCTGQAACPLALELIPWVLDSTFLRPVFPSCTGKNYWPSGSFTGFRQGNYRGAGSNRREKAQLLFYLIFYRLWVELRVPVFLYNFSVQNIVTATTLPYNVYQDKLYRNHITLLKYEPDLFPGIIYKKDNLALQIFDSGKINAVGARTETDPIEAIVQMEPLLRFCRIYEFACDFSFVYSSSSDKVRQTAQFHADVARKHQGRTVLEFEHTLRENRKTGKLDREFAKKHKCESKALLLGEQELKRVKKKRKAGSANSSSSSSSGGTSTYLQDLLGGESAQLLDDTNFEDAYNREMAVIQQRLRQLPSELVQDISVFVYKIQAPQRTYEVEVMADGTMLVLDADSETQAFEAAKTMCSMFGLPRTLYKVVATGPQSGPSA